MASYEEVKNVCNRPEVYLIDVRSKDEIAATGTIPCSINIPRKCIFNEFIPYMCVCMFLNARK